MSNQKTRTLCIRFIFRFILPICMFVLFVKWYILFHVKLFVNSKCFIVTNTPNKVKRNKMKKKFCIRPQSKQILLSIVLLDNFNMRTCYCVYIEIFIKKEKKIGNFQNGTEYRFEAWYASFRFYFTFFVIKDQNTVKSNEFYVSFVLDLWCFTYSYNINHRKYVYT